MEPGDLAPKAAAPIEALLNEDLSRLSLDELAERKAQLQAEIARIEEMITGAPPLCISGARNFPDESD